MAEAALDRRVRPATGALGERIGGPDRLQAIDILRGLVIVLMVLDHVRDFFYAGAFTFDPVDPQASYGALYATRWVTHLCAPSFVFLAGVSAFLKGERCDSRSALSRFLVTRGLWLILLELTVVNFGWTFGALASFLQVIWAIGAGMVLLAGLVWLGPRAVLLIGVLIIAGHNLLDPINPAHLGQAAPVWNLIEEPGLARPWGHILFIAYPAIPWLGIMCLGYGLGGLFLLPREDRIRWFVRAGLSILAIFFAVRGINLYGDPVPWTTLPEAGRTVMSYFNVTKYPPSLLFTLATLGPAFLLLAAFEKLKGPVAEFFLTFGRVPLFVYVLHIYLAHLLQMAVGAAMGVPPSTFVNALFNPAGITPAWGFGLAGVYLIWLLVLVLLYPAARWFGALKRRRRDWWLSYL